MNILLVFLILFSTIYLGKQIEKHSVHPKFGNYTKNITIDNKIKKCEPWDYCPPLNDN